MDLSEPLGATQARAAVISDPSVLFGGISAEGEPGDIMMINDRVRFVIQGVRDGNYILREGGGVIDADIVRPDGQVGRDAVEEWSVLVGFGRTVVPDRVQVISDGRLGGPAIVRVTGKEGPLKIVEGALETPGLLPNLGMTFVTDYVLMPGSWLLEVSTTIAGRPLDPRLPGGDALLAAPEVTLPFVPGAGLNGTTSDFPWIGVVSNHDDMALLVGAPEGGALTTTGGDILTDLVSLITAYAGPVDLDDGTHTWRRTFGVGPDLATLSDAVLADHGVQTEVVSGTITAADGPVQGARAVVLVDDAPYTIAVTDADGAFSAQVPAGSEHRVLAEGRGNGLFIDLPAGAGASSPYAADPVEQRILDSLRGGAMAVPSAAGRGVATVADPLTLQVPATLQLTVDDGLPFTARLSFVDPDPAAPEGVARPRPNGLAAAGWSRDDALSLVVEPGTYDLLVHRGLRYELFTERITLQAGDDLTREIALPEAFDHAGWLLADPHMHSAPSPDGELPMEDRLVGAAAVGLQVHFGTDHDHLTDYRPLLEPLGIASVLTSVVSDEVSPPLRGHFNIYPVDPADAPNGGAWLWWIDIPENTEAIVDALRARHGPDFVLQSNHPNHNGVANHGRWSAGQIARPSHWTDRLEAVEVLNAGEHDDFFPFWHDVVLRGRTLTPVGVSDSHSHFGGIPGVSATFILADTDDPTELTDARVSQVIKEGLTLPTLGAFLDVGLPPGTTHTGSATLSVTARSASWAQVDRLILLQDGVEVERIEGTSATFTLKPEADALYVVVAEGDQPMAPLTSRTPWAMAGPYRVDVEGDGWSPPLAPLQIGED